MNLQPQTWPKNWRVLQLSDTHLFADTKEKLKHVETLASFAAVWQAALAEKPQVVVLTGDLSQDDSAASYAHLATFLEKSPVPVLVTPGNHDQTAHFDALFQLRTVQPTPCFDAGKWQIIVLNSMQPGQVAGRLAPEILQFLQSCLKNDRPLLIAMHHPPLAVGSLWMDRYQLENKAEFWQLVADYPQVRLVLAGHVHQEFVEERQGVAVFTVPSTCTQFLPCASQAMLDQRLPGFRLVDLAADGSFTTQVKRVHPFISQIFSDALVVEKVSEQLGLATQPLALMPLPARTLLLTDHTDYQSQDTQFQASSAPDANEAAAFWQWLAEAGRGSLQVVVENAEASAALLTLLAGVPSQAAL
jgi:Icc protein